MSLVSGLYTGKSSLETSQNALNTVAHNLSNIETPGYTRQQTLIVDRPYNGEIGNGCSYKECRQIRDFFLDESYRNQNSEVNYLTTIEDALTYVEDMFYDVGENDFKKSVENIFVVLEEFSKNNGYTEKEVFNQRLNEFKEYIDTINGSFESYKNLIKEKETEDVARVNEIGKMIATINKDILKTESFIENANDLRDKRNSLIDELSQYGKVKINFQDENTVIFNEECLVDKTTTHKFENSSVQKSCFGKLDAYKELLDEESEFSIENIQKNFNEIAQNLLEDLENFQENFLNDKDYEKVINETDKLIKNTKNCIDEFDNLVIKISDFESVKKTEKTTKESCINELTNIRLQLYGVSSDEELSLMIQYQNSYNVASRYITTINDMLDTIINRLGG